jgi:hypothetical protein
VEVASLALEMTITKADFLRLLPGATEQPFQQDGKDFSQGSGPRGISLRITELPRLPLGAINLDRLRIEITFRGYTTREQNEFLARFRLQYHRGGG